MGLRTVVSRICLVAVFFFSGISNLSNLPLARSDFEDSAKRFSENYKAATGSEFYLSQAVLQQNSYLLVTLWSCLSVVCSIATVLKVKWSAWVLVAMLLADTVPAWYEQSTAGTVTVLKNLAMVGGLLVMMCVIASKQKERVKKRV